MRTIANAATLSDALTQPTYLVMLGFSPALHLSSGIEVDWDGSTWAANGIRVDGIESDNLGRNRVSVNINNLDRVIGALVLAQSVKDRPAEVYLMYPDGSAGSISAIQLVDGTMDGASIGDEVSMNIVSKNAFRGSSPRVRCAPPVFNHMPPTGTILRWGGSRLELRRE